MGKLLIALGAVLAVGIILAQSHDGDTGLVEQYEPTAKRIRDAAATNERGYQRLTYLCDRIGHRLSGTKALERAIDWSAREMRKSGLANVRKQPVTVPHWVRGRESAHIVSPVAREIPMLGLGGSIATPEEGIEAEVVAVGSFDELAVLGSEDVKGKIVLYDAPYAGYGKTVPYRTGGASRAAELGAVAALVRSVTGRSLQSPHTGAMRYDPGHPSIPVAAITVEDATYLHRITAAGTKARVRLRMESHFEADAQSANVMGEIPGSETPEEIVVMGGHIDSWDVGQGAHDDGAGCIAPLEALAILKDLGLQPRRTLRVVFWTNEENGLAGGRAYREALGDDVNTHVAAVEMDSGSERFRGFGYGAMAEGHEATLAAIGKLVGGEVAQGGGGADIGPLMQSGVPGFGLRTVGEHYFDWHHTHADTIDKVDPEDFRGNVAALAVLGYVLADMPGRLDGR